MHDDVMTAADRRAQAVATRSAETGIDDALLERLVRTFYGRIRTHAELGPIFEARVEDWEDHMRRLTAFWSSVALGSGTYSGSPMRKHLPLPIDGTHFDQWLRLFYQTCRDVCPHAADYLMERALRIAESLEMAIATENGVILGKGERFRRLKA